MLAHFDSLFDLLAAFPDEQSCIDHVREIRWRDGEFCPHCGGTRIYHFSDRKTFKCGECRQRFSIKVGTIFEDTKLPLRKWFMAIWMITNHPKGIASTTMAKDLKITQKTAWFVLHRVRHAARTRSFNKPLKGIVEVDETWVGGKDHNRHWDKKSGGRGGKGSGKTPVIGAVERQGNVVARVLNRMTREAAEIFVRETVSHKVSLPATDESHVYHRLTEYPHASVHHASGRYVVGAVHTNTIEGFWSIFKRGVVGTFHKMSAKYMPFYVAEFQFRYNNRENADIFGTAINGC